MSDVEYDGSMPRAEWEGKRELRRKGLDTRQDELRSLESSAVEAWYFLPTMVTGLLATPAYIRANLTHSPGDVSTTVEKKIARQEVLRAGSCSFTFVLTEQAIRWAILPPEGMAEQADHLVEVSCLENVRLGVLPFGTVLPRGPMNTFTVYDDRLATVEIFTGRLAFRDPATWRRIGTCSRCTRSMRCSVMPPVSRFWPGLLLERMNGAAPGRWPGADVVRVTKSGRPGRCGGRRAIRGWGR